jgi:hypothetical protein
VDEPASDFLPGCDCGTRSYGGGIGERGDRRALGDEGIAASAASGEQDSRQVLSEVWGDETPCDRLLRGGDTGVAGGLDGEKGTVGRRDDTHNGCLMSHCG